MDFSLDPQGNVNARIIRICYLLGNTHHALTLGIQVQLASVLIYSKIIVTKKIHSQQAVNIPGH